MKGKEMIEPELATLLSQRLDQKIPALPLRFEHMPVELLSKEFTRLNNPHPYRIHYLGPRFLDSLALHRRYAYSEDQGEKRERDADRGGDGEYCRPYPAPLRRIVSSNYMNERLQDNHHYRASFFYRAFEGMNPTLSEGEFCFNSAFQGGNLDCAIKVRPAEFDLFLRIDSNSRGHTNWYYFSIKNGSNVGAVTFNICNLGRRPGLYDQGLRPFVKSTRRGHSWEQSGEVLDLLPAHLRYNVPGSKGHMFFRLSFSYIFQTPNDEVFFAYCVPYTYSDLHQDLKHWEVSQFVRRSVLGRSLSGLQLPLLHITDHGTHGFGGRNKKNVVITGRVHPAQSNGSFVLKGFVQWLLGDSREANELRERTNIFIIPMLNPDGVVMGNSRASAAGKDLNRQFLNVRKQLYPEVYLTKCFMARLQKKHKVLLFLDFHGHSRKKNTFFYGPAYPISHKEYYRCRALPKLIQKINPSFRFYSCSFQISEAKRSTARAIALSQLKVPYVFTVQSSVGLFYDPHAMKTIGFNVTLWEEMGGSIALGLTQFLMGLQQLEVVSRQRKLQRQRLRQGKGKQRQKQSEGERKQRKRYLLLDIIEQVKIATNKGVFDEDIESDDHDSADDLEPYQLSEFNNLVTIGRQRQRKAERKSIEEEEDQNYEELEAQEEEEVEEVNPYQDLQRMTPTRLPRSVEPKMIRSKAAGSQSSERRIKAPGPAKEQSRISLSNAGKQSKNFIKSNRRRFSSTNLRVLGEDRCEIISLPKTPPIKREKLARRDSKLQFQSLKRKGIRSIVERMEADVGKYRSPVFDPSLYASLHGLELDNRAMTITTFRRK